MRKINLNGKTKEELSRTIFELRAKLRDLNFDLADKKLKNVNEIKKTKKDIARILTAINRNN